MLDRPLIVGVRQSGGAAADQPIGPALAALGHNTGNMMFTQALTEVLAGARWGSFNFTPQDLEDRDCIVLASANWVNGFEDFGWLADRLEPTKLPVFLVGLGAQSSLDMEMPALAPGTRRLLDLVRDRSRSIAARGAFSCEVLDRLGIKTAVETGCPSLMLAGPRGPAVRPGAISTAACMVHATRHGIQRTSPVQCWLYQQALRQGLDLVLQSELTDMHLALSSPETSSVPPAGFEALADSYGTRDTAVVGDYLARHGRVFFNYPAWIEYARTRTFCFGTRIHGTVAALIAGVPATLICHDSRTLEMARTMGIPMVLSHALRTDRDLSIDELLLPEEMRRFGAGYGAYYANYLRFFADNALSVSETYSVPPERDPAAGANAATP